MSLEDGIQTNILTPQQERSKAKGQENLSTVKEMLG